MGGYTIAKMAEVPDALGDYPGEMRMLADALGAEQVALTFRRMPQHTGGKGSYGHRHDHTEEVYFVVTGTLQFKLDDEVVEVTAGTAVRVAAEVVRSIWNDERNDAELVIVSTRGEDEAQLVQDFWPE
jgi:mannose-6-phosphate isomerase-like protein (cupin superfamily)